MANYYDNSTSNQFKVRKSEKERLEKIFNNLMGDDVHTDIGKIGEDVYGWFGCYGSLIGLDVENYFEDNEVLMNKYQDDEYNAMCDELQKCLADDSHIVLMEAGHEKLRYVNGGVLVITPNHAEYTSLDQVANAKVEELLSKVK